MAAFSFTGQAWHSFGRGEHGELGREVVSDGATAAGAQNYDVRAVRFRAQAGAESTSVGSTIVEAVWCGHFHNLARVATGEMLAWGLNNEGQLALEGSLREDAFVSAPAQVLTSFLKEHEAIVSADCGRSHTAFVANSGRCFVAGRLPSTEAGQLEPGRAAEEVREVTLVDMQGNRPCGRPQSCHAGESHTVFLTSEGEVWTWLGDQVARRIGYDRPSARAVLGLPRVLRVTVGWHHILAITEERKVVAWGAGNNGQLGLGSCRHNPAPSHVQLPEEVSGKIVDVAAGFASSFAVTSHGWVYAWGANERGQLGLGVGFQGTTTPKPIDALSPVKVVQVSAGHSHTAALTIDGLLYLWGHGGYGQLGFAFDTSKSSTLHGGNRLGSTSRGLSGPWMQVWPRRCLQGPFGQNRCLEVRCGAYHTIACASGQLLSVKAVQQAEVMKPAPADVSGTPGIATAAELEEERSIGFPPGAGLIESPGRVLHHSHLATNTEIFRQLTARLWPATAQSKCSQTTQPTLEPGLVTDGSWTRALARKPDRKSTPNRASPHPLDASSSKQKPASESCKSRQVSPLKGVATWDVVDEALHSAMLEKLCGEDAPNLASVHLNLAELAESISSVQGPSFAFAKEVGGMEPRSLARMEGLLPRPHYMEDVEAFLQLATSTSHAASPQAADTGCDATLDVKCSDMTRLDG